MDDPVLYVASVYEAFHDEPERFDEFLKLERDIIANRIDEASAIARMTELMKGHRNLLQGLSVFFRNAKITIPHWTEQLRMSDETAFLNNVKKRFETVDSHKYNSIVRILVLFKGRKMSYKNVRNEILDLLYYHEDLTEEFIRIVPPRP